MNIYISVVSMFALFGAYIYYIVSKYGVLRSISASYYTAGSIFTLFCVVLAAILASMWQYYGLYIAGAATGAVFVGVAARFKEKMTKAVHYIASGVLIAGGLASVCVVGGTLLPFMSAGLAVSSVILSRIKNPIWWAEVSLVAIVGISMLIWH